MSADEPCTVHISYPHEPDEGDETWLVAVAARHDGKLSPNIQESFPAQRSVRFPTVPAARGFVDELTATGRWEAELTAGRSGY